MTVASLFFVVETRPQPQGSMVRGRHGGIHSDNKHLAGFREAVGWSALAALRDGRIPMAGEHVPVSLDCNFYFERPKSVKAERTFPAVRPDLDKLCRAVCDACTGVLWADDGQVCEIHASKFYGAPERAEVTVRLAATEGVRE